ncbi:MAG: HAD family hydrolase [Bauldia sp.]|nr:HAD family hydrolase [Bauldia sp.]
MTLQALIFDVDGTLADTERDGHRVAFNRAFADEGLDWHWDEALYGDLLAVTGGKERIAHYVKRFHPDWALPDAAAQIARMHQRKTAYFEARVAAGAVPLRPGVVRLIREAREAGLRLAIATTTSRANVVALIEHMLPPDLRDAFEILGTAEEAPVKKPAPDVFHYVLQAMSLDPADALAIEDSRNGLLATTAAGLRTLVTVSDYAVGQDFTGALAILDGLGEPDAPATVTAAPDSVGERVVVTVALLRRWFETTD